VKKDNSVLTAAERQAQRLEELPRPLANKIAAGEIPRNFYDPGLGLALFYAAEASLIVLKGGGEAAERWLESQYSMYKVGSPYDRLPLVMQRIGELQRGEAASTASAPVPAPSPASNDLKASELRLQDYAAGLGARYTPGSRIGPATPAMNDLSPSASAPLGAIYLALVDAAAGDVVGRRGANAEARDAFWLAHQQALMDPTDTLAFGNPVRRDLVRSVWTAMPDKQRSQFYGRHSKLLFDN
jgi:hypothetical protein